MTKRVAICFSGQPRISYNALNALIDNVCDPLYEKDYKIDTFVHFWNEVTPSTAIEKMLAKLEPPGDLGLSLINEKKIPSAIRTFLNHYSPQKVVFEPRLKKENFVLGNFQHHQKETAHNYNSQYHSVKKSHDLCRDYEIENNFRYDYVIRARTDLSILSPLKIEECSKNHICVPSTPGHQISMTKEELMVSIKNEKCLKRVKGYADSLDISLLEFVNRMLCDHTFDETKICNDQFIISYSDNMYKISRLINYMEKEINDPTSQICQEMNSQEGIGIERILWLYIQTFSKIKKLNIKTRIEANYP